jgi:hypothetical protein
MEFRKVPRPVASGSGSASASAAVGDLSLAAS